MAASSGDIPGFYYDKEKRKYFKILPTHQVGKSVITSQTIKDAQAEEKRLNDLSRQKTLTVTKVSNVISSNRRWKSSLLTSLDRISTGQAEACCCYDAHNIRGVQNWTQRRSVDSVQLNSLFTSADVVVLQMTAVSTQKGVKLLQLLDTNGLKEIVSLKLQNCKTKSKCICSVSSKSKRIVERDAKSFCICPMKVPHFGVNLTTICVAHGSGVDVQPLNSSHLNCVNHTFCDTTETVWCCASNSEWLSYGCERRVCVTRWADLNLITLRGFGSCIHSQLFCNQNTNLLYSATKKGFVCMNDLRAANSHHRPEFCLNQGACLFHMLQSTKEPHLLLASDSTGKIKLWDLRVRKSLQAYESAPQYLQLPFQLDSNEQFLYGAGQDGYTRVWDFRTGSLLKSVPPPVQVTRSTIPRVYLVEPGSQLNRLPILVSAVNNKLYFYESPLRC